MASKQQQSNSSVLHRTLLSDPPLVTSASGATVTLSTGQTILDATSGAAVSCLGHHNQEVRDAVVRQLDTGVAYCASLFFGTGAGEELARMLVDSTGGEMTRVFVVSSGSEAMEAALKMARQYHLEKQPPQPQRTKFIARKESYHGTTLGALGVGGHVARRALFEPLLTQTHSRVSACNAYRGLCAGETVEGYVARLAQELDDEFVRLGPENVCAFVAEPVVGAALGCVPAVPGYFKAMRRVCDKYGALLILDEVMCGIGRTGTMHAWQSELVGVVPDIQTIGKGLGAGYAPVAAVLASRRVVETMRKGTGAFSHGQTYQGHPLACAAALAVMKIMKRDGLVELGNARGVMLEKLLREKVSDLPFVGDVRGKGLFWGIEFVKNKETKEAFDLKDGVAMGIHTLGMQEPYSISLYPGTGTVDGIVGDHILLCPPYNVTEDEVCTIVDKTAAVIKDYFAKTVKA